MIGRIFDIKEMTLHDGDGVRLTVFLKGCPLRCEWCHNPEGLKKEKQLLYKRVKCVGCELCKKECEHEECQPFSRCLHICPKDCLSVSGEDWTSEALAKKILSYKRIFNACGGGVTFSGGEPLMQAEFLLETVEKIKWQGIEEIAVETSGYAPKEVFSAVAKACSQVILDIKIFDREKHKKYTGVYNDLIKENFLWLKENKIPHLIRTPLIEGKTDDKENLQAIKKFIGDSPWEKLPENKLAKAKYDMLV